MKAEINPQPPRLFGPGFFENPYPTYHALRAIDPILWDDTVNAWVLTRYADVAAALNDPRLSRQKFLEAEEDFMRQLAESGQEEVRPLYSLFAKMMLFADPPKHTRLRNLVHQAFTPRVVETMRAHIQEVADDLLDAVQDKGRMDVIKDLAYPLPVIVIGEMLGLPPENRAQFKRWSDEIIAYSAGVTTPEQATRALKSMIELTAYFRVVVARVRHGPRENLMSALVAAEEEGDKLSEEELLATAVLLLMNGHETTTNMIGNGLLALLRYPEEMQRLRDEPTLIANAVEELLRYDGSVQLRGLTAKEDFAFGGKPIRRGKGVIVVFGAANRDPAQFPDPDRLDLGRRDNRHLEFGRGIHFCIGAALARAELQLAIGAVLRRMPKLELATDTLQWHSVPVFRGLKALPVVF
jgi:pimeloyl-[acyl-carrier protein] synthase